MTAAELKKLLAKHGCSLFALPPFGLPERNSKPIAAEAGM